MTATLIEAHDLYRFFHTGDDEVLALRGVSLRVDAGEVVAVVGPSGSGKSTLLACLAGLDTPDGGTVLVAGEPLSRRSEPERAHIRNRHIGVLLQSGNLLERHTVLENVTLVQRLAGRADHRAARTLLEQLGIEHRASAQPGALSGGEHARAGLAVALANTPQVVLADEPTGELDSTTASSVVTLLRRRADEGSAVVVVTHDTALAEDCDRIVRLHDGSIEP